MTVEREPVVLRLAGVSVLLVDDNEDARYVMGSYLTYSGAHAVTVKSALEALELLERMRPSIIVTDMSMPGMSGLEFLHAVRKLPGQSEHPTPFIACTAFSDASEAARQAGFQAYLVKPIDPRDLVSEVARITLSR